MPVVTVETWPLSEEQKPRIIKGLTELFTGLGIPAQAVTVIIHETPKENWGSGGEQHSEKFRNI